MLQWFIRFPELAEITEFNESSDLFRKNSHVCLAALVQTSTIISGRNSDLVSMLTSIIRPKRSGTRTSHKYNHGFCVRSIILIESQKLSHPVGALVDNGVKNLFLDPDSRYCGHYIECAVADLCSKPFGRSLPSGFNFLHFHFHAVFGKIRVGAWVGNSGSPADYEMHPWKSGFSSDVIVYF